MHDQTVSRISGRTRAAVSAMCVRVLRISVLKSAGNFTRDECHDLNAEKIQRVKCFMFTTCGFIACRQFSNAGAADRVQKFQAMFNWRKWRFASSCPVYPRKQTPIGRRRMSAGTNNGHMTGGHGHLYSVPYLRAIWLICSRVSCFGGTPGGLQVSRKKLSRPGGVTIQSSSNS